MMRTALLALCLATSSEAFSPSLLVHQPRSACATRMTLVPERVKSGEVPLAKKRALEVNRDQWKITAPLSASAAATPSKSAPTYSSSPSSPPSAPAPTLSPVGTAYRTITNDEIRVVAQYVDGKSGGDAESALAKLGFEGALLTDMMTGIQKLKDGSLTKEAYEIKLMDAKDMYKKHKATKERAEALQAEASTLSSKVSKELEPTLKMLDEKVQEAQSKAESFGWVPFSTAKEDVMALKKEREDLKAEIEAANVASKEAAAGASALMAASTSEGEQAKALYAEGIKMRRDAQNAQKESMLVAITEAVQQWEQLYQQGQYKKIQESLNSPQTVSMFKRLALVPSPAYGASSLPGRIYEVMNPPQKMPKKEGAGAAAAAPAADMGMDMDDESRRALIGVIGAALLGAGGFFAYKKGLKMP